MKISRAEATTFAILLAIIAALSLYLVLRGGDRVRYELPKLARVSASEIDGLEVTLPGADTGLEVLRLKRSGTRWTIEPQGYRADASIVEEITRELASLKITDLVSMSAAGGARYGLDANSRVTVKASRGGDVVRALHVGNRAPTDHHSYAALLDDTRVYYAEGNLKSVFARRVEELRDRTVLELRGSDILSIEVRQNEGTTVIRPRRSTTMATGGTAQVGSSAVWETSTGVALDREELGQAIDRLESLACMRFVGKKQHAKPLLELMIEAQRRHTLSVFPREGGAYPATSSDSAESFELAIPVVEALLRGFAGAGRD